MSITGENLGRVPRASMSVTALRDRELTKASESFAFLAQEVPAGLEDAMLTRFRDLGGDL
jgi:hypothetical protein